MSKVNLTPFASSMHVEGETGGDNTGLRPIEITIWYDDASDGWTCNKTYNEIYDEYNKIVYPEYATEHHETELVPCIIHMTGYDDDIPYTDVYHGFVMVTSETDSDHGFAFMFVNEVDYTLDSNHNLIAHCRGYKIYTHKGEPMVVPIS